LEEYAKLRHAIQTQFDLEDYQHKGIDGTYSEYLGIIEIQYFDRDDNSIWIYSVICNSISFGSIFGIL
jgi:hypothetical protein